MRIVKATLFGCLLVALWFYLNGGTGIRDPVLGLANAPPGIAVITLTRYSLSVGARDAGGGLGAELVAWKRHGEGFAIRYPAAMPDSSTRVYVIVEDRAGTVPVSEQFLKMPALPYRAQLSGKNQLEVQGVDREGSVYLSYDGKGIRLAPGERRLLWGTADGRPHFLWIEHHGVLDKAAFVPWRELQDEQGE